MILNRKAEVSSKAITGIIILILSVVIILLFLFRFDLRNKMDKEICHNSVVLRSTAIAASNVLKEALPLKCKTQIVCLSQDGTCEKMVTPLIVKVKNKAEVYHALAEELADCWWMFGEGNVDFVGKEVLANKHYCSLCSQISFDDSITKIKDLKLDDKVYSETGEIDEGCNACYPTACEGLCINNKLSCINLVQTTSIIASNLEYKYSAPETIDCTATLHPHLCQGTNICTDTSEICDSILENSFDKDPLDLSGTVGAASLQSECFGEFPFLCDAVDKCVETKEACAYFDASTEKGEKCPSDTRFPIKCKEENLCANDISVCSYLNDNSVDKIEIPVYRTKECNVEEATIVGLDRKDFFQYLSDTSSEKENMTYWEYLYTPKVQEVKNNIQVNSVQKEAENLIANNIVRSQFLTNLATVYEGYQSGSSAFTDSDFSGTMIFSEVFTGRAVTMTAGFIRTTKGMKFPQFSQPITGYPDGSTNHFWDNVNDQKFFTRVPLDRLEEGDVVFARKTCSTNPSDFDIGLVKSVTPTEVTIYATNRKQGSNFPDTTTPLILKTFNFPLDVTSLNGHIYQAFRYTEKLSQSQKDALQYSPMTLASAVEMSNEVNTDQEATAFLSVLVSDSLLTKEECTLLLASTDTISADLAWAKNVIKANLVNSKITLSEDVQLEPIALSQTHYVAMGIVSKTSDLGKFIVSASVGGGTMLLIYGTGGIAAPFIVAAKGIGTVALLSGAGSVFLSPAFEGESGNIFIRPDLVEASSDFDKLQCADVKTLG